MEKHFTVHAKTGVRGQESVVRKTPLASSPHCMSLTGHCTCAGVKGVYRQVRGGECHWLEWHDCHWLENMGMLTCFVRDFVWCANTLHISAISVRFCASMCVSPNSSNCLLWLLNCLQDCEVEFFVNFSDVVMTFSLWQVFQGRCINIACGDERARSVELVTTTSQPRLSSAA